MSKVRTLHVKEQNSNHMLLKVKKQQIEELKKVTRSRQPPLLGASTCLSFFRTISNSLFSCILIKHLITAFKSAMLFTVAMALTISFTPDTFYVAKQTWNYRCLILQKKKKSNTPFMPRRSCDFSTILGVFFSSLGICMSTLLAAAARAFIFSSKIGFVSAACTYSSYMKLRGNSL